MIRKIVNLVCALFFFNGILAQTISEAEYYVDAEPGVGSGTTLTVPNQPIINTSFNIDISTLDVGFHVIYIRTKDNNNVWGLYDKRTFYVTETYTSSTDKIVAAEYYFDAEVGIDKGTKLTLSKTESTILDSFTIDVSSLDEGFHTLQIRVKSDEGLWSLYDKRTFYVTSQNGNTLTNITKAEYYFDKEVGTGNGVDLPLTNAGKDISDVFDIDISTLEKGFHTIYIRVMNADNVWSTYDKRTFYISESFTSEVSKIIKAEYYFNEFVAYDSGTEITLPENLDANFDTDISTQGLAEGEHLLFIRAKNEAGIWSLNDVVAFTIDNTLSVNSLLANQFKIYPNPVKNKIQIKTNKNLISFEMYDVSGKSVLKNRLLNKNIDISRLTNGVYFLILNSEEGKVVKKIVKQ